MRRSLTASLMLIWCVGCGRPPASTPPASTPPAPTLRQGDIVRPEIVYAPNAPWKAGAKVVLGMLLEVHRPGRAEPAFLLESDVKPKQAVMRAQVTFLTGDELLGDPLKVPFVKDC